MVQWNIIFPIFLKKTKMINQGQHSKSFLKNFMRFESQKVKFGKRLIFNYSNMKVNLKIFEWFQMCEKEGKRHGSECSVTETGQVPICKLKWDLLRISVTACTIDRDTFSAPFGIFSARTKIWKEIFQKKSYTNP